MMVDHGGSLGRLATTEKLLRRWVLKAWARGAEAERASEKIHVLEQRLADRSYRPVVEEGEIAGSFDTSASVLELRRERNEFAKALAVAADERDAAEARADAAEARASSRSSGGSGDEAALKAARAELEALREENGRLKRSLRSRPAADDRKGELQELEALLKEARAEGAALLDENAALKKRTDASGRRRGAPSSPSSDDGESGYGDLKAEVHGLRYVQMQNEELVKRCEALETAPGRQELLERRDALLRSVEALTVERGVPRGACSLHV